jgi:hypothetical protein
MDEIFIWRNIGRDAKGKDWVMELVEVRSAGEPEPEKDCPDEPVK